MSKFVKNIITEDLKRRLDGVDNALLVNVVGMKVNDSNSLRATLAEKGVKVMVVKNSLAARAFADDPLGPAFDGLTGNAAVCWGASDMSRLPRSSMLLGQAFRRSAFLAALWTESLPRLDC